MRFGRGKNIFREKSYYDHRKTWFLRGKLVNLVPLASAAGQPRTTWTNFHCVTPTESCLVPNDPAPGDKKSCSPATTPAPGGARKILRSWGVGFPPGGARSPATRRGESLMRPPFRSLRGDAVVHTKRFGVKSTNCLPTDCAEDSPGTPYRVVSRHG